jgi:phosphate transport system substrate-binding protein
MRTAAFGEALPMACEDTDWGRAVNRRVEVWVE